MNNLFSMMGGMGNQQNSPFSTMMFGNLPVSQLPQIPRVSQPMAPQQPQQPMQPQQMQQMQQPRTFHQFMQNYGDTLNNKPGAGPMPSSYDINHMRMKFGQGS